MGGVWQVDRAPRVGALRLAALTARALPAAAIALRIDPVIDPSDPRALLDRCVAARIIWHPSTAALLEAAGASEGPASTYTLPVRGPNARPTELANVLARVHPSTWTSSTGEPLTPSDLRDLFADAAAHIPPHQATTAAPSSRIAVTAKARTVTLRLLTDPLTLTTAHTHATIDRHRSARVTPTDIPAVLSAARKANLVTVDADTTGRFADLGWTHERRLLLRATPGAPGYATTETGPLVTAALADVLGAVDAVAAVRPATGQVAVATDPLVAAAAAGATAAPVPSPVAGVALRSWQEAFIGQYLANGTGLVNALPPGAGKSACVGAAMAEAQRRLGRGHRGLVVAPTTLLEQWQVELGTFHPDAHMVRAASEDDLGDLSGAWSRPGPVVLLTSPALVARHPQAFAALAPDDLAVDEGTFLRVDSAQTRALWQVRAASERAVVLTGTPDSGLGGTVEAIVAFVAGRRDLMGAGHLVAPQLAGMDPIALAGAWIFGHLADLGGAVPATSAHVLTLTASMFEDAVSAQAAKRIRALLDAATTPAKVRRAATAVRTELEGWRTGLACPAALMAGRSALARAVREHLTSTGHLPARDDEHTPTWEQIVHAAPAAAGVKAAALSAWLREGNGAQSLIFADSVPALETLAHTLTNDAHTRIGLLTGKVRPAARARLVDQYTNGDLTTLLVAGTGHLGLNLQSAARLAHLDVPTSAALLTQRAARAARMGSTHVNVPVHMPLIAASAEQTWWARATGAGAPTDLLTLARSLL